MLEFDPNVTTTQWVEQIYPNIQDKISRNHQTSVIYDCTIYPNEVLYFPDRWMHATLNENDYNFFVSVFLDKDILDKAISASSHSIHVIKSNPTTKANIASDEKYSIPASMTTNQNEL